MADSAEPVLALEAPAPRTLDDGAPDETVTDDSSPQHARVRPNAKPRPTDVTTTPVTYDISDTIRVPTFDPDAVIRSVTQNAKSADVINKTFEKEVDALVRKGMDAASGLTPESVGMKGEPGMAMLQRTAEMEARGRRAAGVLEQYVKFPPQPIEVHYEIMGGDAKDSVPVLITPRGRKARDLRAPVMSEDTRSSHAWTLDPSLMNYAKQGLDAARVIAKTLVQRYGCKCIIWDRPNTGKSGISWEGYGSEAELQSDYLNLLLAHLKMSPVVLYGEECGGLLALVHALRYPEDVGALILENVPAGQAAARYLARKCARPCSTPDVALRLHLCQLEESRFYIQYLDTLGIYNKDGLIYVAKDKHYAALIQNNPANARRLLSIEHSDFKAVINRWAKPISEGGDAWMYPVLGIESAKLRELQVPTLCLFTWTQDREEDAMHTEETMQAVVECLAGAYPAVLSPAKAGVTVAAQAGQKGSSRYDEEFGHWLNGLPRPLKRGTLLPKAAAAAAAVAADLRTTAAKAMTAFKNGGANVPANMQAPNGDTCSLFQGIQVAGQMRSQQRGKPQGQQCSVM